MLAGIACFSIGILLFQWQTALPDARWTLLLIPLIPLALRYRRLRMPVLFAAGFLWALWRAWLVMDTGLPPELEGKDLRVRGTVAAIPEPKEHGMQFIFDVSGMEYEGATVASPGRIRLSWQDRRAAPSVGQEWEFLVRLKRPNGYMNPGGFDGERWLFQQRIRAAGYVKTGKGTRGAHRMLADDPARGFIDRQRAWLGHAMRESLGASEHAGIVIALAIGQASGIAPRQWDTLNATGTNHLMSISGLHISLVAGLVFALVRRLWRLFPRACLALPDRKAGALAGIAGALVYSALAGFSIPTQRTLIMLTVAFTAMLMQREVAVRQVLGLAWLAVLLLDPFAILSVGFWLSFTAVAIIFYTMGGRQGGEGWWWKWGRVHWMMTIGLIPFLLLYFQSLPVYSFLANAVAVPVVSLLAVPVILLGCLLLPLLPAAAGWLLRAADGILQLQWQYLEWVERLAGSQWMQHAPLPWAFACGMVGILLLLAPKGWPGRWTGALWLLPMFLVQPPAPAPGDIHFTMLDVGQGLSAVVRTHGHTLVYDTGPRHSESFDTASTVVAPYLAAVGAGKVDTLVLSHDDNDHSGAARSLLTQMPVGRVLSSMQEKYQWQNGETCQAGMEWEWDGVRFRILHPARPEEWKADNNRSCVLHVQGAGGSILLPGDIERRVEKALAQTDGASLKSDIVVAPHHGSRSSSSPEFIAATGPRHVLYSNGYRNRYGFPRDDVAARYREAGAQSWYSDRHGAITFEISAQRGVLAPVTHRQSGRHYWNREENPG